MLKIGKTEFIHLDYHPINLKVLSKDRLLIVNVSKDDSSGSKIIILTLHDEHYNVIKITKEINGESISENEEIAINEEKKELYFLDRSKYRIIVVEFYQIFWLLGYWRESI